MADMQYYINKQIENHGMVEDTLNNIVYDEEEISWYNQNCYGNYHVQSGDLKWHPLINYVQWESKWNTHLKTTC